METPPEQKNKEGTRERERENRRCKLELYSSRFVVSSYMSYSHRDL